jgi:single-stranded DNA-binding protein
VINKVIIIGVVEGLKLSFDADGKPQCSFTLRHEQDFGEGRTSKLFVAVDTLSTRAESIAEMINNDDTVLVDGALRWKSWTDRKTGEKQGKLAVLAWGVTLLSPSMVESAN